MYKIILLDDDSHNHDIFYELILIIHDILVNKLLRKILEQLLINLIN